MGEKLQSRDNRAHAMVMQGPPVLLQVQTASATFSADKLARKCGRIAQSDQANGASSAYVAGFSLCEPALIFYRGRCREGLCYRNNLDDALRGRRWEVPERRSGGCRASTHEIGRQRRSLWPFHGQAHARSTFDAWSRLFGKRWTVEREPPTRHQVPGKHMEWLENCV